MNYRIILLALFGFFMTGTSMSQDIIGTGDEDVKITPVLHGSVVFEYGKLTIFVDPYGGAERFSAFDAPDLVFITDIHGDHLNEKTLLNIDLTSATLVVPKAVYEKLQPAHQEKAIILGNGMTKSVKSLDVKAIPMYNLPEDEGSRHPKGRGNGYILTMGGKRFYLSGDTEAIPEMRNLDNIEVAFVCMNLPYTMDVDQAADGVNDFQPRIVYPYHYRGSNGLSDIEKFRSLVKGSTEVRLRNWYPE